MEVANIQATIDTPYCENGCGNHATIQCDYASLCEDCATMEIREELIPLLGTRCCFINRDGVGNLTVCLSRYGVEHSHEWDAAIVGDAL